MDKKENKEAILSEQEVWDTVSFADFAAGYNGWGAYGNALTPMLLNERMKQLNLDPAQATEDALTQAINNPQESEIELQGFNQDFETQSQVYKRLLSYLGNMLAFDMTYECTSKKVDYKGPAYNKDLDKVKKFFDTFDYKEEFSTVVGEMLRNEAYFCCPRLDFPQRTVLQELPASPQYTMITGRWDYGMLFSFNMYWFWQPGVDIDLYPDFFKPHYDKLFNKGGSTRPYNPALAPGSRGRSSWVYWQDIPVDVGWMFKMNPALAARVPYFTGLFLDLIQQPVMRALQKNANLSTANRMLAGEIGVLKEAQAKEKDQFNISPKLLGNFLALVKSSISEAMKVAALPLNNVQGISFPGETDLYSSYVKTMVGNSGVNSNLIFATDQKLTTVESMLSVNTDEQLMYSLYPQFERFLEYQINKSTTTYKFNFHFEGSQFYNDREARFDRQMELLNRGIVLPQKVAASMGMSPFAFQRQMEEAKSMGFVDGLTPIILGGQQQEKEGIEGKGRPKSKTAESTEDSENTKANAGNVGRGAKKSV